MSSSSYHLEAIPASLFFLVPLATLVLFLTAISRKIVQHPVVINIQLLDRPKQRVLWVFPVVFSLALLAILAGAILFLRQHSVSFSLAVADSVVTSVLYLELNVSIVYLLSVIASPGRVQRIAYFFFCSLILAATLVSIVGSFKQMPPVIAPSLYLSIPVLILPVIAFSFLSITNPHEPSVAPRITLSSTCSFPTSPTDLKKPRSIAPDEEKLSPMSQATMPSTYATRSISLCSLFAQISAIVHFAFDIGSLVLLPAVTTSIQLEALALHIVQTVFLVLWIICTMSAFLQLFTRANRPTNAATLRASTASDNPALKALPAYRAHPGRPKLKTLSSSFTSPPPRPRRGSGDFQNLYDPFASPRASRTRTPLPPSETQGGGDGGSPSPQRPTRMSAWGACPPSPTPASAPTRMRAPPVAVSMVGPPRPQPNVLVINPPARRLPSLRSLRVLRAIADDRESQTPNQTWAQSKTRNTRSMFSYTTPSAYSQDFVDDTEYEYHYQGQKSALVEEALLAQKLLRRLDAAGVPGSSGGGGSTWAEKLGRSAGGGSATRTGRLV